MDIQIDNGEHQALDLSSGWISSHPRTRILSAKKMCGSAIILANGPKQIRTLLSFW